MPLAMPLGMPLPLDQAAADAGHRDDWGQRRRYGNRDGARNENGLGTRTGQLVAVGMGARGRRRRQGAFRNNQGVGWAITTRGGAFQAEGLCCTPPLRLCKQAVQAGQESGLALRLAVLSRTFSPTAMPNLCLSLSLSLWVRALRALVPGHVLECHGRRG